MLLDFNFDGELQSKTASLFLFNLTGEVINFIGDKSAKLSEFSSN